MKFKSLLFAITAIIFLGQSANAWELYQVLNDASGGHAERIHAVSFLPKKGLFITGSADKTVKVWALEQHIDGGHKTWTCVQTLNQACDGHTDEVCSLAVSPDETMIATGSRDTTVKIWEYRYNEQTDRQELVCVQMLQRHTGSVNCLKFSPNGQQLVTGSCNDKTVKFWEIKLNNDTNQHQWTFAQGINNADPQSLSFSPDNLQFAIGTSGSRIYILKPVYNNELGCDQWMSSQVLSNHNMKITAVSFSESGQQLVTASVDNTVNVWHYNQGTTWNFMQTIRYHNTDVQSAVFVENDKKIMTSSRDGDVAFFEPTVDKYNATRWTISESLNCNDTQLKSALFLPDYETIITISDDGCARVFIPGLPVKCIKATKTFLQIKEHESPVPPKSKKSLLTKFKRSKKKDK